MIVRQSFYLAAAAALLLAAAPVHAQAPAAQTGTTLITLGTAGGPVPQATRAQSSNLLIVNGTLYLIDAGGGVTGRVVHQQCGRCAVWRHCWCRNAPSIT